MDYGVNEFRRRYFSEITQIDAASGRLLDYLDESGLAENTIVVFTSDHGEMNGCHGLFGKGTMYEESIKVPLLVRLPGAAGQRVDEPVSTIDLFPTLLDLCGIAPPAASDGRTLRKAINGEGASRPIFFEYDDWIGIMKGTLKLSINRETREVESCFDVADDPHELKALVDSSAHADLRKSLAATLIQRFDRLARDDRRMESP